jgi:hypothetical protein
MAFIISRTTAVFIIIGIKFNINVGRAFKHPVQRGIWITTRHFSLGLRNITEKTLIEFVSSQDLPDSN